MFPPARRIMFVGLSFCTRSMIMPPPQDMSTITENSFCAWTDPWFATQIVPCWNELKLKALCDSMLEILDSSLSLPKIDIGAECTNPSFLAMEKIPFIHWFMYMVLSKISTVKLLTLPYHACNCRVPILRIKEVITCTLIDYLIAVWSLDACRRWMQLFQLGLR